MKPDRAAAGRVRTGDGRRRARRPRRSTSNWAWRTPADRRDGGLFASGSEAELLVPSDVLAIAEESGRATHWRRRRSRLAELRLARQPEHHRLGEEVEALKKQISAAEAEIPTTLVMEEMKEPRDVRAHPRGAYDKPGEAVTAATPAASCPPSTTVRARNRLGLARWLVSPRNPLTARVTVNRFWQADCSASAWCATSEDFGSQGEPPSHPELLDWLAVTFRDSGWDVKRPPALIVTSATYRQQSHLTPERCATATPTIACSPAPRVIA